MKKTIFCCVLSTLAFVGSAQTYSREFGKIGRDDLEMKAVPFDADAEAVVLFDLGDSQFVYGDQGFEVIFQRQTRIKVLSEAGLNFAEFEIPVYQDGGIWEKILELEAVTYNLENGNVTKTKLDPSTCYTEKVNEHWNVQKFAMPNVKTGSVVECRYKIISQYFFNLRDWEFQWRIPVMHSVYKAHICPFFSYMYRKQGSLKLDINESYEDSNVQRLPYGGSKGNENYRDIIYVFGMNNVPAFRDEAFITSVNDYVQKIDFQLTEVNRLDGAKVRVMTTWEELIKELNKNADFGRYISRAEKLAPKMLDLPELQIKSEKERFDQVMDVVKTNFSWNGINSKFASKSPEQLMKEKTGNSADLNLFAIGLLRAAGIATLPLISSTRGNGKVDLSYPFANLFNYTLLMAVVDCANMLSDATQPLTQNNRIPARCINDQALVIDPDKVQWFGLEIKIPSRYATDYVLTPDKDFNLSASVKHQSTEYEASYWRNLLAADGAKVEKELAAANYEFDPASVEFENPVDRDKAFTVSYRQSGKAEQIDGKLYINPFMGQSLKDNPLKQKVRTYPVDMVYPTMRLLKSEITIPEGFEPTYLPADKMVDNDYFSFAYSTTREGQKLVVSFNYFFKKAVYPTESYARVKLFFNDIIKWGSDRIVLSPVGQESSSVAPEPRSN